ncbi:hypothetical protein ES332_A05G144200v1 [Gossypium tomentosum]|uniref:Uncharacterized protein n=1 Tax=Gossypium tomentosum TaxID=34277 RepID=A0A5D2QI97_GOSTO|nr:hypothetical protein ES332_A05G144200v1 [Gossypium tomentosum]
MVMILGAVLFDERDKCYLLKEHATRFWKQTAYISSDMVFSCTFSLPCNSSN